MNEIFSKELSINELFTLSFKKYKELWSVLLPIILIIFIPTNLVLVLLPIYKIAGVLDVHNVINSIVQLIFALAVFYLLYQSFKENKISYKTAINYGFSELGNGITVSLLYIFLLLLLFVAIIIPGIIFAVYWQFALFAIVVHGVKGMSALNKSKQVVKGRWWKVLWYTLVFYVVVMIVSAIIATPFAFMPDLWLTNFIYGMIAPVITSFLLLLVGIYYINLDSTIKAAHIKSELPNKS